MGKAPALSFCTVDWLSDAELSLCSPATRGIWMDLLCRMHDAGRSGEVRGNLKQLAVLARCLPSEAEAALADLADTGAADVSEKGGVYTVRNRRMNRVATKKKAATSPAISDGASLMAFPISGAGDVKEWQLTSDLVARMVEAYPAADVLAECKKALAWIVANPSRRKTAFGMPRFLNSWMGRVQDKGGSRPLLQGDRPKATRHEGLQDF